MSLGAILVGGPVADLQSVEKTVISISKCVIFQFVHGGMGGCWRWKWPVPSGVGLRGKVRVTAMAGSDDWSEYTAEDEATDRSLVARLRGGDESAASELYRRYAGRLHGLADRQMSAGIRRTHEPDDIVQSAFRSLFRGVSSGSYDAPEGNSLWSLLAVIAIHKVRRKASRDRSVAATSFVQPDGEPSSSQEIAGEISEQQFECSLNEAIEFLQPQEREIVGMRVQGFTVEEISAKVDRSCRTIERTLQRIREKLSEKLEADWVSEE